jgi:hypothetical protein
MRSDVFADDCLGFGSQPVFAQVGYAGHALPSATWLRHAKPEGRSVVEPDGIEPTTSCLQSTRSPS